MAYTFLAAQGYEVGHSLLEADKIPQVTEIMADAERRGVELVLPVDIVAATRFAPDAEHEVVSVKDFPADRQGLDIGPASRELFAEKVADARTVFWNGPMGVFEFPAFAVGTRDLAEAITRRQRVHRGRRRRLGGGRAVVRPAGGRVRPHLHRWRRQPGVPGRTHAARPGRPWRPTTRRADGRHERPRRAQAGPAADGRQLEDEQEPPRGHRAGPEARLHAVRQGLRRGGRGGAAAVHVAAQRADAGGRGPAAHRLRGAGRVRARRRRLHRRGLGVDAGQAGLRLRAGRALRSGASTITRTTPWSTPRSRPRWAPRSRPSCASARPWRSASRGGRWNTASAR